MSEWLLNKEEMEILLGEDFETAYSGHVAEYLAVAKAQLRKVLLKIERDGLLVGIAILTDMSEEAGT